MLATTGRSGRLGRLMPTKLSLRGLSLMSDEVDTPDQTEMTL